MVQYEGWIYYSNQEKGGGIYRQSIDGLRLEKLNDAKSDYINIVGNSIYYRQVREHAVCKMSLDGSNKIRKGTWKCLFGSFSGVYFHCYENGFDGIAGEMFIQLGRTLWGTIFVQAVD